MQDTVIFSFVWLEKMCLSYLSCIFLYSRYPLRVAAASAGILIFRTLLPLPSSFTVAFSVKKVKSPTVSSQTSCALAPLAYIKQSSARSLLPITVFTFGKESSSFISSLMKKLLLAGIPFFCGIFNRFARNIAAVSKSLFCAYSEKAFNTDSL